MQRGEDDPQVGAQAARPNPPSLAEVLNNFQLSDDSEAQLTTFVDSLTQGISKPHFRKLSTYALKFTEYNRSKYEMLRTEQLRLTDQANSLRDELNRVLETRQEQMPQVAPIPSTITAPTMATQPLIASLPSASLATAPMPSAPAAAALPLAFQAQATSLASQAMPSAFQAHAPLLASQAKGSGPFAVPAYISPAIRNPDGTISRRMDHG